ncbi:MAG: DMT family transporter [Armatimonadota bacterium]|nr:DMT family transporter [Armatimonadota bacterium]MDR7438845.1 DMT family transporter [Armatimonadota bacterium]MDR7562702.1 DMT family transporter [Armatimonadota bacterium]MDR7567845.1 DMT family transporter [Armatimonadota bacterium]MDR7602219.1 DMT family transporter [Armatimonadota bacterium]
MRGEGFALLAAFAFALSAVYTRRFTTGVGGRPPAPPEIGVLASLLGDLTTFGALAVGELARGKGQLLRPESVALFLTAGLVASMLGRNLAFFSVKQIGAGRSTAVRLSNTVFSAAVGWVWLRDLPRPMQLVGIVLVTVGLWVVVTEREGWERDTNWAGVLTAVSAALAFAVGDTARRAGLLITPSVPISGFLGACAAIPAQLILLRPWRWPEAIWRHLLRPDVLASGGFNSVALLFLTVAVHRTPVANAAALYNLQVLLVIALGRWMLRGEDPGGLRLVMGSATAVAGAALVLGG